MSATLLGPAAAAALLACHRHEAAKPKAWPPGTVLAVDAAPITAEEVDRESVFIERVQSEGAPDQLRRLALTNIVLPRTLSRLLDPAAHERARAQAQAAAAKIQAGDVAGVGNLEHFEGGFPQLGMVMWGVAMDLEDGQWSDVIEDVGRFFVVRRTKRVDGPIPLATRVEVDLLAFPWLPAADLRQRVERAHDEHHLTIVDPAWRAIVPELIQYRMGVHQP